MDGILVFSAIAGMVAFMGGMIYWSHVVQKKRTAGFEEQAQQLGLHFVDDPESQAYSQFDGFKLFNRCLLYTSPSPRDRTRSRMPSSA